jgi:hypothetical protein
VKVGDLVRVFDPDEQHLDGSSFWTIGILVSVEFKTPNSESYRIFSIYSTDSREGHMVFDEPYWAAEIISPALTD